MFADMQICCGSRVISCSFHSTLFVAMMIVVMCSS
uniref:Uncharacterized protein n=1 Tax=Rhizophora mucronata TaxID=61149 RepID=A0A2P2P5T1_RHIMU